MSLMKWMLGSTDKASGRTAASHSQPFQASTQFASSQGSGNPGASPQAERKELLRIVLRETLTRNGIPLAWMAADALTATSSGRPAGTHIRLLIKHWDPRLARCGMGFQQDFEMRLITLDPLAATWLMGISWQYALPDDSVCPALPHPDSWRDAPADTPQAFAPIATRKPVEAPPDIHANLERLLAASDADMRRHTGSEGSNFAATEPAPL